MSGSMVADQKDAFENERFLSILSSRSKIRYMLYEHARIEERRSLFREDIHRREISITFEEVGINTPGVSLCKVAETSTEVRFESHPLIFSGVNVVINGHIRFDDLTGFVKMDLNEGSSGSIDTNDALSEGQKKILQSRGLPIP